MKSAPAPTQQVIITDPRRAEGCLADAYHAAEWTEEARAQVHGILSALVDTLSNDKLDDPRPFIDAALLTLKRPLATIATGAEQVRTSLVALNEHLSQPLDFVDAPDDWDVELAKPRW